MTALIIFISYIVKLIAITDIHGHQNFDNYIAKVISNADLVLIAGDITHFGAEEEANTVLRNIKNLNNKILAVPGNCDHIDVINALRFHGFNLHGECREINGIVFYGLGGSNKTPLRTPQEYSESEIDKILNRFKKKKEARFHILLTHSPPAKTKLDKIFLGLHVGSKAIRKFIEKFQPDLVICGHIHESMGSDKIGKTVIINPGPFPKHYVVINLEEKINYELY